jgi:hypothetical protein
MAEAAFQDETFTQHKVRGGRRATGYGLASGKILVYEEFCSPRKSPPRQKALKNVRLREIEKVIAHIFPCGIPDCRGTDDLATVKNFIKAYSLSSGGEDVAEFSTTISPWFDDSKFLKQISAMGKRRRHILSAQDCAGLLCVDMDTRTELKLKTIGACDISEKERKRISAQRKRLADRERQAKKRREAGCLTRAEYLIRARSPRAGRSVNGYFLGSSRIGFNSVSVYLPVSDGASILPSLKSHSLLRRVKIEAMLPIIRTQEARLAGTPIPKAVPLAGFGAGAPPLSRGFGRA